MDDDDDRLLDDHNTIEASNERINDKSIDLVNEWFIWSYLNVLIGGVIFGLIAIGCSFRTNKFKRRLNYSKAKKWSDVTFFVNLLTTLSGLTLFGYLIARYFHNVSIEEKLIFERKTAVSLIHP